ncbi:ParB/RepB/Spo0J family partition protein [Luminiphilus sp.]|nr:ParB/RepB/Spo0J family partition protein [Luminiphilus sp.]MDA8985688.1 ParB/RepB/Spo0J family partition protein [Luminiphilus sp.]
MAPKRKLNRGLEALLGTGLLNKADAETSSGPATSGQSSAKAPGPLMEVPIEQLQRGTYQPRRSFAQEALQSLAESIRAQGILQPIVARALASGGFEILSGERRWRAAQLAELPTVPVVIKDVSDEAAIAIGLIENIQREDLNPVEEALGLKRLQEEFGLNQEQVASAVGRSRPAVANLMRLLQLESEVLGLLERQEIDAGHAKALLALSGGDQVRTARQVYQRGLSVRQTEALVRSLATDKPAVSPTDPNISRLETDLSKQLGAQVKIRHQQSGRGRLEIHYTTLDELDGVLKKIR